jgi:hypothetical protein
MTSEIEHNPYYETDEFKNSFSELVELSKTYFELGKRKRVNFEGLAESLYSEVGHYIYELLQNADDAHATEVKFRLNHDSLELEHNGSIFFTFENIEAICSYGADDKRDQLNSIGRFGIGFKSTSRITDKPEIRSNQFAFQIMNDVIPEQIDASLVTRTKGFGTHFKFPFGTSSLTPKEIFKESLATLMEIDSSNLLFLNHISLITIELAEGESRFRVLGKKNLSQNIIELKQSLDGTRGSVVSNYFLKYSRTIDAKELDSWATEHNLTVEKKNGPISISIAMKCTLDGDSKTVKVKGLTPIDNAHLFVFFPAKKETSGLKFHIHAPFAATSTRESIKESNPVNKFLFSQFPALLNFALEDLISHEYLDLDSLDVFPNNGDSIRSDLEPMRKAIYDFFILARPRIPLSGGGYSALSSLREVSNEITSLLNEDDLKFISSFNRDTVSSRNSQRFTVKPKNSRAARFLTSIGIINFGLRDLVVSFSHINTAFLSQSKSDKERFMEWITGKEDAWIKKFYILLSGFDLSRIGIYFNKVPIIRISDEVTKFEIPANCFISKSREQNGPFFVNSSVVNVSSSNYLQNDETQILRFLDAVGVRQFSKSMMLEDILKTYIEKTQSGDVSDLVPGDMIRNALNDLLNFIHGDVELERAISSKELFLTESLTGELAWHRGRDIYVDKPFMPSTGLDSALALPDFPLKKFRLWAGYAQIPEIGTKLARLDVMTGIVAKAPENAASGQWSIPFLEAYLANANTELRRLIWSYVKSGVANRDRHYLRFPNSHLNASKQLSDSANILRDTAWIPDKNGILRKPSQIVAEDLPLNFTFDKCDYLESINFGADSEAALREQAEKLKEKERKNEAAKLLGASDSDELEALIKAMKKDPKRVRQLIEDLNRMIPADRVANPLLESERVTESTRQDPDFEFEPIIGSQRIGVHELVRQRKDFLRATYQSANLIACQICSASSFIKTTNNEPYFVGIMVIESFSKNSIYNAIALCAQCAAKFKYAKKSTDFELKTEILNKKDFSGTVQIKVVLGGDSQHISFVESHFFKLKGALSVD